MTKLRMTQSELETASIPFQLMRDGSMSCDSIVMYLTLDLYPKIEKPTMLKTMRFTSGLSIYKMKNALRELETAGWIEIVGPLDVRKELVYRLFPGIDKGLGYE